MPVSAPPHGRRKRRGKMPASTGFPRQEELQVTVRGAANERPPRPAWISDALLVDTIEVWSEAYERPVGEDEAIEILENVGRLGEALLNAKQETHE